MKQSIQFQHIGGMITRHSPRGEVILSEASRLLRNGILTGVDNLGVSSIDENGNATLRLRCAVCSQVFVVTSGKGGLVDFRREQGNG